MELWAMEHSMQEILQHTQSYNLEGVLAAVSALAQFMRADYHID